MSVRRGRPGVAELFPQTVVSAFNFQWISEHICRLLLFQTSPLCFFILRTHLSSPTPAHCSLWNTVQKYSSTQKYSNLFLWKRLFLALALIKLYYMWYRNRWIKKYSNKGNYGSLTEKVRMHSDLKRLDVAEKHDKYSSAQKQYPDYRSANTVYL